MERLSGQGIFAHWIKDKERIRIAGDVWENVDFVRNFVWKNKNLKKMREVCYNILRKESVNGK